MRKFVIFWLDSQESVVEGNDIADAFRRAGYGGGAVNAIDYYAEWVDGENRPQRY